jgi:hypothetical protein
MAHALEGPEMSALLVLLAFVLVAVAAPFWGVDTSDARNLNARPEAGWWPANDRSDPHRGIRTL